MGKLHILNWRTALALAAIAIVSGTILYSNHLAKKIALEEREKISQWVEANKFIANAGPNTDLALAFQIQQQNADIPIIQTNEKDSIIDHRNLDTLRIKEDNNYLAGKLQEFRSQHKPIILELSKKPYIADKFYYGNSELLKQVKYYPIVQLLIVALFIFIIMYSVSARNRSTQNQVWAGLAKETAHQLGTPISSLQGWTEILKDNKEAEPIVEEMTKDIDRLKLISDRFSKIGSTPKLEVKNISTQIEHMVEYIKRRATKTVTFSVNSHDRPILAEISAPLFDWVMENLLKNALDAMEGKGAINIDIRNKGNQVIIDVTDTGKGISPKNIDKVFKPGFSTKKRGWGLGLSLARRIIEQYHKGHLFVKHSEVNKGTTFRIVLNK